MNKGWYKSGVLTIVIHYPAYSTPQNNFASRGRKFLEHILPESLKDLSKEIYPLIYSNVKISKTPRIRSKISGGQCIYIVQDVTPLFFKTLFDILEEKKKAQKFISDYFVTFGNFITKKDIEENEEF